MYFKRWFGIIIKNFNRGHFYGFRNTFNAFKMEILTNHCEKNSFGPCIIYFSDLEKNPIWRQPKSIQTSQISCIRMAK